MMPLFKNYQVLQSLGKGGVGFVYQIKHIETGQIRALKYAKNPKFQPCIQNESSILQSIQAAHVPKWIESGVKTEIGPYVIRDWVDGIRLDALVPKQGLHPSVACQLFTKLLKPIQKCHEQKIVHLDLNPSNYLINEQGAWLIDFGNAKFLDKPDLNIAKNVMGAKGYVSPEQVLHQPISYASDVYALGAILRYLMFGKNQAPQTNLTPLQASMVDWIQVAMDPDPKKRFQSLDGIAFSLELFLH